MLGKIVGSRPLWGHARARLGVPQPTRARKSSAGTAPSPPAVHAACAADLHAPAAREPRTARSQLQTK
jgi:hypothetical protein